MARAIDVAVHERDGRVTVAMTFRKTERDPVGWKLEFTVEGDHAPPAIRGLLKLFDGDNLVEFRARKARGKR